jgi:putative SOS response-associated peptidase YedK
MRVLHDRLPAVLEAHGLAGVWLGEPRAIRGRYCGQQRRRAAGMAAEQAVNSVRNNGAELIQMAEEGRAEPGVVRS